MQYGKVVGIIVVVMIVAAVVTFGVTALLVNIFERKQEGRQPDFRVLEITDDITDPSVWGTNYPIQYDQYRRTVDMVRTRHGGSEALPRTPTTDDPRTVVTQQKLEEDPRLKEMWAGYAFAIDFREERGHAYMLEDQTYTARQQVGQPGACVHCHASVYVPYKELGGGDIMKGFEIMNPMPYAEARQYVEHPVACIDCHDPRTMALRITRPGFLEGIQVIKAQEGIDNYDVNTMATRQEMRSFVCGQCHVEYYFHGDEKRLTYPWFNGVRGDEVLAYFDEIGFADWIHAETGAPMLKAQHPEFEMWSQGIHARSGVACADCHMPYMRVGAQKVSDHHVRSPLLNINNACQTCHPFPEQELLERAETIQARFLEMRDIALDALMELIAELRVARAQGMTGENFTAAQDFHRKASFLLDYAEAENSAGFHAPQEASRIVLKGLEYVRQGQNALRGAGLPVAAAETIDTQ
jgi:nitrite reductase (cytochrome c-552)